MEYLLDKVFCTKCITQSNTKITTILFTPLIQNKFLRIIRMYHCLTEHHSFVSHGSNRSNIVLECIVYTRSTTEVAIAYFLIQSINHMIQPENRSSSTTREVRHLERLVLREFIDLIDVTGKNFFSSYKVFIGKNFTCTNLL